MRILRTDFPENGTEATILSLFTDQNLSARPDDNKIVSQGKKQRFVIKAVWADSFFHNKLNFNESSIGEMDEGMQ